MAAKAEAPADGGQRSSRGRARSDAAVAREEEERQVALKQLLEKDEEAILSRVQAFSMRSSRAGDGKLEGRFRDEFVVWCFLGLSRPVEFALPFFSSLNFAEPISPHLVEVFPRLCSFVSPVAAAAEGGQAAVLRLLLAYGASANHTDWRSIPASQAPHVLHFASSGEVAEILLDALGPYRKCGAGGLLDWGVYVDEDTKLGGTPLQTLALRGRVEAVRALLKRGASVFEADITRTGVLSWACMGTTDRTLETIHLLLSYQVPVNMQNERGRSALHIAVRRAMADPSLIRLVELLLDHGADVHAQDRSGHTPLCLSLVPPPAAAEQGGADPRARRSDPVTYAVAALLIGRGARLFECTPFADGHDGHEPMCHLGLSVRSKTAVLTAAVSVARAKLDTLSDAPAAAAAAAAAPQQQQPHPAVLRLLDARQALGEREAAFSACCGSQGAHALSAWRAAAAAVRSFAAESRGGAGGASGAPKGRGKRGKGAGAGEAEGGGEQGQPTKARRKLASGAATDATSSVAAAERSPARAAEFARLLSELRSARAALASAWADTAVAVAGMVAARAALRQAEAALRDAREHHAQGLSQLEKELEKVCAAGTARSGPAAVAAAAAAAAALAADGEEDWGGDDDGSDSSLVMGWSAFESSEEESSSGGSMGGSDDDDDDDDEDDSGSGGGSSDDEGGDDSDEEDGEEEDEAGDGDDDNDE